MASILTRKGMGTDSLPIISEICGAKVYVNKVDAIPSDDLWFRWGCTGEIPNGPKIVNKTSAIHSVSDKKAFRELLNDNSLCPKTWPSFEEYLKNDSYKAVESVIIRPAIHSRSENLFFCTSLYEAYKATQEISGPYYTSEYIKKTGEYRVMVAQNRVLWVIKKKPKKADDISWGCVEEGNFEYVAWTDWPMSVVEVALKSVKLSELDFGAVDVIVCADKAYTLEINTAPWLSPYYAKCIGKAFKWIINNGRDHFEDTEMHWDKVIHPAIRG